MKNCEKEDEKKSNQVKAVARRVPAPLKSA